MESQTISMQSDADVVTFLKGQHERIKALFSRVLTETGPGRDSAFRVLRRLMAVHETAEEEIVHPVARRTLPNGEATVRTRLHEENQAKVALAELEALDSASSEFEAKLRTLQANVLAHAQAEEEEEFVKLALKLDESRLARMRKAVELAEAVAPTRPHPGIESATANLLAGPFASMMDRVRDALH